MLHRSLLPLAALAALAVAGSMPSGKIYGVNLGSWLVLESWMLPAEWAAMGGQQCSDCSQCISTEFAYAKAYPTTVDAAFYKHWTTWFTQSDVDIFVGAKLNTVRIPLGFWIIEPLVDRSTEYYPRGGIKQLQRGLAQLNKAGIAVILDHHALPGVHTPNQMFAGQCTSDVQFYTPHNYHRALVWTVVMASLSHLDPVFSSVFAIQAVNEPIMDATQTPGYGDFQRNFVQTIRAVELALGIAVPGMKPVANTAAQFTDALTGVAKANIFNANVSTALVDAVPMLLWAAAELVLAPVFGTYKSSGRTPLTTNFMDVNWQYNNPPNPAAAAIGPQTYDNHLYYNFGGVADPNEEAYLTSICNLQRVQNDAAVGDSPLWFGEWAVSTQFNATDAFLRDWADAQKLAFTRGAGWIWWNFHTESVDATGLPLARQWSYEEGLRLGYLTQDPAAVHNPNVCANYTQS